MIWTYEDENISIEANDTDIKYDAEYMNMFVEQLTDDINWYKERARELERSYVRYHNNETFVGEMANASKRFIYDVQGDKLHTKNLEIKKDFLFTCFDIENRFKEQVDSSPRARISTTVLLKIKKDFGTYYAVVDTKGYEIECHARRLVDLYGKWGISTTPCYRRAMMAYEDFCGNGGFLDKCIKNLENFDQESYSVLNRKDFMGSARALQAKIKNTASALDSMTVFKSNIAKNTIGLFAFGASTKSIGALNDKNDRYQSIGGAYYHKNEKGAVERYQKEINKHGKTLEDLQKIGEDKKLPDYSKTIDAWLAEQEKYFDRYYRGDGIMFTLKFVNKVQTGGDMDIKQEQCWSKAFPNISYPPSTGQPYFIYHGQVMDPATLGNVVYAYVGAKYYSGEMLRLGGGVVQTKRRKLSDLPYVFEFNNYEYENVPDGTAAKYGEAPEDIEAIDLGLRWRKEGFPDD